MAQDPHLIEFGPKTPSNNVFRLCDGSRRGSRNRQVPVNNGTTLQRSLAVEANEVVSAGYSLVKLRNSAERERRCQPLVKGG